MIGYGQPMAYHEWRPATLFMLRVIVRVVGPARLGSRQRSPTGEGIAPWTIDLPDNGDALTGVEMFAGLEPDVRQRVIATAVPRTYRKGQILFVEHDPGESLIIMKRGAVAVFRTAPTGERAVLTVVRPPDVLGEVSLLDALTRSASAEAIEDSQALTLSRAAFMELVHSNPRILDAVMRSVGALIRRLTEQNSDHVFLDLPGRVAKTLVRLAGESQAPMITIELNQSQLAEMAGGSRQSVNQAIGSFASRGWLRTEGRRIVVTDLRPSGAGPGCRPSDKAPGLRPSHPLGREWRGFRGRRGGCRRLQGAA